MAFIKQFLTKTKPSYNTTVFRYSPVLPSGELEIYSLISISNDANVETARFNKFVWDGFLDGFLSKEDDIISRLKYALVGAEFKLKELIRHDDVLEEKGVDLNLSVLIFKENKVFVGILGNHQVFLRKKRIVDLSELLSENKSNVGSTIVSSDDFFVVSSHNKNLKSKIEDLNEIDSVEGVLQGLFDEEKGEGGAFLATLTEEKKVVEPAVLPEESNHEIAIDEEEKVEEDVHQNKEKFAFKEKVFVIFGKIKKILGIFVTFLSEKLTKLSEKIKFVLRNKYGRKRWYKKLQSKTSVKNFAQGVKPFKVDGYKDKELKTRRFVMLFIILVLVFTVFLGVRSAYESRQRSILTGELNALIEEWDDSVNRAERRALENPEETLEILGEISGDLKEYLDNLKDEGRFERLGDENMERIEEFENLLSSIEDKAYRVVSISEDEGNIELFLDTKLSFGEKSNPVNFVISKGSQIVGGEVLYLIDSGEKVVYEIPFQGENYIKVSDPRGLLKNPLHIDLGNNKENEGLYIYDAESGALRAGRDEEGKFNNFESISGLNSRSLGGEGVTGFAVFGLLDSLNFLVPAESRILRAEGFGGTTYNLPVEYISHPSFEKGTDLFGDQYVLVLSTTPNGIKRFVPQTGLNSQLMVTGLQEDLNNITTGYTGPDMDRTLVVYDSELERFFEFTKPVEIGTNLVHPGEIVLKAQYEYRGNRDDVFKDVKAVALTDNDRIMYVLDGRKIWQINLD